MSATTLSEANKLLAYMYNALCDYEAGFTAALRSYLEQEEREDLFEFKGTQISVRELVQISLCMYEKKVLLDLHARIIEYPKDFHRNTIAELIPIASEIMDKLKLPYQPLNTPFC